MQANDFYRGVLFEIECIHKIAAEGSTQPVPTQVKPTVTADLPAQNPAGPVPPAPTNLPSTAPVVNTAPTGNAAPATGEPVVAGVNSAPQTGTQLATEFRSKFPEPLINKLVSDDFQPAIDAAPQGQMLPTLENAYNDYKGGKANENNPFAKAKRDATSYYLLGGFNNKASGGGEIVKYVEGLVPTIKNLPPTEQANFLKTLTQAYPNKLAPAFQQDAKRYIDESADKMSAGDLWNKATGPADPTMDAMGKQFPELKSYATHAALGRAGTLTGDWLKNNWGKLAAGVGGGSLLIALLSKIMGGGEEQTNQPIQRRVNAPQSF